MKVLLATPTIAHYRSALYHTLLCGEVVKSQYFITADSQSSPNGAKVIERNKLDKTSMFFQRWSPHERVHLPFGLLWQRKFIRQVISDEFDVVIMLGNAKYLSVWLALVIRRLKGGKALLWTHGLLKPDKGLKRLIRISFYSLAHGLLLYGNRGKRLVKESGLRNRQLSVIYNSLDYFSQSQLAKRISEEEIIQFKSQLGIDSNAEVLITTGRLLPRKKIDLIIELLPSLNKDRNVFLIVVGDGPAMEPLKGLASALNVLEKVIFFGACYEEITLARLMKISDVYVLPSHAGLSVIHGLTYGLPVVTHDNFNLQPPEVEALEDGVTGSLYNYGDSGSLHKCILNWLDKVRNNNSEVALACQKIIEERYSPEAQARFIDKAVHEVACRKNIRSG